MLGHKSLSTTMIYLRTLENSRKDSVETLSGTYKHLMEQDQAGDPDKPSDNA